MEGLDRGASLRGISFRGRVRVVVGCVLAFIALVLPFYNVEVFNRGLDGSWSASDYSAYYWSFKSSAMTYHSLQTLINRFGLDHPFYTSWKNDVTEAFSYPSVYFSDYWFDSRLNVKGLSELLIVLFAVQLLVLAVGLASLFIHGRLIKLTTTLLGAAVIVIMLQSNMLYSSMNNPFWYIHSLRLGFWFAVLAEFAFLASLV